MATSIHWNADSTVSNSGDRSGSDRIPAECDVSIRPGWFYHASEDEKVRSPENLFDLYLQSVGRGASLLSQPAARSSGTDPVQDVQALTAFRKRLDAIFKQPASGAKDQRQSVA